MLSHFPFPFFPSKKRTLFTHLCGVSLMFWVWKKQWPIWLKTLDWFLVQAQVSGWQWPDPCHVNPHWMAGDSHSSWNCKVSPVSQPVMSPSKAIAGPLMYFGPCPLLYLAKLWESTVYLLATGLCQKQSTNVSFYTSFFLVFPWWHLGCVSLPHLSTHLKKLFI